MRATDDLAAQARLSKALRASADTYGMTFTDENFDRCHAVPGDITTPLGGADPRAFANVTDIWHIAASLAFEDERATEISLHNEQGTKNIVDLALKIGCAGFNYVSTAYVAGDRRGAIPEEPVDETTTPSNHYERSKIAAEKIVTNAGFTTARVLRPSIVVGHSETYGATTFSGLYGFVRGLEQARDKVRASLGDLLQFRPLRLLADGDTPVNFIPIDYVARAAVEIAINSHDSNIYHLANSSPPKLSDCWASMTRVLGMKHPLFVDDAAEFSLIDEKVDRQMNFYRSYLNDEKHFSVSNAESILGIGSLSCPLNADDIAKYVDWYLRYREAENRSATTS